MMKTRMYKQVVELGHYVWSGDKYWDDWVVDSVIEEADEVLKYVVEARKKTTSFCGGVYYSDKMGRFCIQYYLLGTMEID